MNKLEHCEFCDEPTGKAGRYEDSLYLWDISARHEVGPLCESCYFFAIDSGNFLEQEP